MNSLNYLERLQQRVSYHVHELTMPAPNEAQLQQILQTAMSSPDHGNLKPWHFLVISTEQIHALIDLLEQAWLSFDQGVELARVRRLANYLKQAPCMVLVSAVIKKHPEISAQDQLLSAAAACQMILLAADALDFGGIWYSTDAANLPNVKQQLGLEAANAGQALQPVGFLVLGTPIALKTKKRPLVEGHLQVWQG